MYSLDEIYYIFLKRESNLRTSSDTHIKYLEYATKVIHIKI